MIIETLDGSQTIRHETLGELYHSDRGALGESLYIYIECGLEYALRQSAVQSEQSQSLQSQNGQPKNNQSEIHQSEIHQSESYKSESHQPLKLESQTGGVHTKFGALGVPSDIDSPSTDNPLRVFEVGFGSGLNAMLTMQRSREVGPIEYHAIELYPLSSDVYLNLMYAHQELSFIKLHESPWGLPIEIEPNFVITKYHMALEDLHNGRATGRLQYFAQLFDVVYFDAFSPDVQPMLWTTQIMQYMYHILKPGGVLVTYSAKGIVKQALRDAGFSVVRLKGALGKRHMVRAIKI